MEFSNLPEDTEDPDHSPAQRAEAASRSTWVSVVVNQGLIFTQIATRLLSKSQGLIADGSHSLSDLVADFVVILANLFSQKLKAHFDPWRRPSLDHTGVVPKPAT